MITKSVTRALGVLVLVLAGCSGAGVNVSQEPEAAATPRPTPTARPTLKPWVTPDPAVTLPPVVTPAPVQSGPTRFAPGDTITVTQDGEDWATIIVDQVRTAAKFDGYFDDVPETKGNVFITARITYKALTNGVDYNPFDWSVFADGLAVDDFTYVSEGPKPELSSGTLPNGRAAQGYVVYEVPAKGEILLSYESNMFSDEGPVFEVVLLL